MKRFWGTEILSHEREAVDLGYAREGLPFLVNHDTDRQVGIIEDVRLGADGRLRGLVRFSRSDEAQDIRRDVEDGIRRNISVGYRIEALKLEGSDESGDTYRATRWTPMEGSTVPVPADITVGVGREAPEQFPVRVEGAAHDASPADNRREAEEHMDDKEKAPAPVTVGESREDQMQAVAEMATNFGAIEMLPDALKGQWSPRKFANEIAKRNMERASQAKPAADIGMSEKEQKRYNIINVLAASTAQDGRVAGFEREVSDAVAKKLGRTTGGFFVPLDLPVATRASVTGQTVGTSSLGGAAVETSVLSLIELLRNRMVVRQLGARVLSGLSNNISFPRQLTGNTVNWTGENPTSANTLGSATFDNLTLSPKTAMVSTAYSRQWTVQSSFDASAFVLMDIAAQLAIGLDLAALHGTGSNNQPTGVFPTSGLNTVSMGTNGGVPTWAKIVDFETQIAIDNAPEVSLGFLAAPETRGALKGIEKTTSTNGQFIWASDNTLNGYRAEVSNQIRKNFTTGTSTTVCFGMIFGNWSELIIGEFGGAVEIITDPYSYAGQNMIAVHAAAMIDIGVRHAVSFCKSESVLNS